MTLAAGDSDKAYDITAGTQTVFAVTFPFVAETDLDVFVDGVAVTTGFSVTGGGWTGTEYDTGEITFTVAPTGTTLRIERNTAQEQALVHSANPDAEDYEQQNDKLTMIAQESSRVALRTLQQNDADATENVQLPAKALRANKLLGFDADGNLGAVVAETTEGGLPVSVWGGELVGKANATAGREHLGLTAGAIAQAALGFGDAALKTVGTGSGELVAYESFGTAAFLAAGTSADNLLQLDGSARLPAVSGRNLTEVGVRVPVVALTDLPLAAAAASSVANSGWTTYENYLLEIYELGVDTNDAELFLELYSGGTLYGVGGTTGKFAFHNVARVTGAIDSVAATADDAIQLTSTNWLSYTGQTPPKFFGMRVWIRNNATVFAGDVAERRYARLTFETEGDWDTNSNLFGTYLGRASLKAAVNVNGFKLRTNAGVLDGGKYRVTGWNGPAR